MSKNQNHTEHFDCTVIGNDLFSNLVSLYLARDGVRVLRFLPDEKILNIHDTEHVFWPSLNDPPTRFLVAHGKEITEYLNSFCSQSLDILESDFPNISTALTEVPCARVATEEFQKKELDDAIKYGLLKNKPKTQGQFHFFPENRNCFFAQNVSKISEILTKEMEELGVATQMGTLSDFTETANECTLRIQNKTFQTEIVIFGFEDRIQKFFPFYENILIPMSTVISQCALKTGISTLSHGIRAAHGHFTLMAHNQKAIFTGPRFLLPSAGVDQNFVQNPPPQDLIPKLNGFQTKNLMPILQKLIQKELQPGPMENHFIVDTHPCDELPVVGEFGKLGRVYGATGFLGTKLSASPLCAKIIKEICLTQKSDLLHPRLQPKRFRIPVGSKNMFQ